MKFIFVSSLIIVLGTIFSGVYLMKKDVDVDKKKLKGILRINLATYLPLLIGVIIIFVPNVSEIFQILKPSS